MFKMNPAAKEFVPAHILKKRQEESERLSDLSEQLGKVELESGKGGLENGQCSRNSSSENSKEVHENSSNTKNSTEGNAKLDPNNKNSTSPCRQKNNLPTQELKNNGKHMSSNKHNEDDENLSGEPQDLIDEDDDRFLLNAGEDICEFNGEQFIIPGDDEYDPPIRAGYDFGNDEDNEDEDVCNAFEEFLENLPSE